MIQGERKHNRLRVDDIEILQEIQKNTRQAMHAIEILNAKIMEDDFAMLLTRQSIKHSDLYNKATERLLQAGKESHRENALNQLRQKSMLQANTLFNTSTSNQAAQMIMENSREMTDLCRVLNQNENAGSYAMEIAQEFMNFEEVSIEQMKKYL